MFLSKIQANDWRKELRKAICPNWSGTTLITNIDEITSNDLRNAQLVEERRVETDKWVFIEACKNPKAISILLRGGG